MDIDVKTFECIPILPDGNCQFRSVSYCLCNSEKLYKRIKKNAINYIIDHKELFSNYIYDITFEKFINNISKEDEWGDEITLLAISLYLNIEINVYNKHTNEKISTYNDLNKEIKKIYLYFDNLLCHYDAIQIKDVIDENCDDDIDENCDDDIDDYIYIDDDYNYDDNNCDDDIDDDIVDENYNDDYCDDNNCDDDIDFDIDDDNIIKINNDDIYDIDYDINDINNSISIIKCKLCNEYVIGNYCLFCNHKIK